MSDFARRVPLNRRFLSLIGWTRSSSVLLGGFFLICGLITYLWWPLAKEVLTTINWHGPWWFFIDWLLLGVFSFMTLTIIAHANLKRDALIVVVGMVGGLVIESWGTQTNLWHYYTAERPPLWIIPAWPIASLSIDRITRTLLLFSTKFTAWFHNEEPGDNALVGFVYKVLYWSVFLGFFVLMMFFVAPTYGKSFTVLSVLLVALLTLTPTDYTYAVLTFLAGSGLGYFLELWGTSRQCWTYYTFQTPPVFAVLAHGMAAVAFWRAGLVVKFVIQKFTPVFFKKIMHPFISHVGNRSLK
jgi:hypothetical protein